MESLWSQSITRREFHELKGDIKTDVLIVGGGIAGLLCAYMLCREGVDCIVVEKNRICGGITKNTTAKITLQHGLFCSKMLKDFGFYNTQLFVKAQAEAIDIFKKLCANIDCNFEKKASCVYSKNNIREIENEAWALNQVGVTAKVINNTTLPFSVSGAVRIENQAQFNPLKFLYYLVDNLNIYEKTKVCEINGNIAVTNKGKITANSIIVATHFPFINSHGGYFLKMYQHRSYVLALKDAKEMDAMYVDNDQKGLSFRNYNGMLLLGGGGHRTGKKGGGYGELQKEAKKYYPRATEITNWAAQDCITLDGVAYIGRYSRNTNGLYVATGFNKWGMTNAMVSALILRDTILGVHNEYAEVFSPSRKMLNKNLAVNIAESTLGLITPFKPRCTHLGCALKYNKQEHSWDCACHGSRFAESGEVIDNPALIDKEFK